MSDGLSRYRPARTAAPPLGHGHAWLIGALISIMVLLALAAERTRLLLRYERSAVLNGEVWRLISGHFVHGNTRHLLLNLAGTGLVALLFGRDYSALQWLWILLTSMLTIAVGFVFYESQLQWYVGFSGALHGAMAAGVMAWWRYENRHLTLIATALLLLKLFLEQTHGPLPFSGDMQVIVAAHLYGAIGGLLAAGMIWLRERYWLRRPRSL
jgi:rhomboid family GlyGly-CTERM serine protease